jgi:hypothetical protein
MVDSEPKPVLISLEYCERIIKKHLAKIGGATTVQANLLSVSYREEVRDKCDEASRIQEMAVTSATREIHVKTHDLRKIELESLLKEVQSRRFSGRCRVCGEPLTPDEFDAYPGDTCPKCRSLKLNKPKDAFLLNPRLPHRDEEYNPSRIYQAPKVKSFGKG